MTLLNKYLLRPKTVLSSKLRIAKLNILILVASTCVAILLCFVIAESIFRTIEPKSPPGTTYGKPVQRNSEGFRDREFIIPKPENTYRILVLGDSFTWGVGLNVEDALPKLIERGLAEQSAAHQIEVINAAIPGHNTVEQLLLLEDKGLKYDPDMIILVYNLNDIEYLPELSANVPDEADIVPVVEIDPGEDITQFSRNRGFRGFILKIERRSALVRFLVPRVGARLRQMGLINSVEFSWVEKIFQGFTDDNPGWVESKNALFGISEIANNADIKFVVAIYPLFVELENYKGKHVHRELLDYCNDIQIHCVDLLGLFENTNERNYWINYVDGHPNGYAHLLVSELIIENIDRYIPK